MSSPPWKSKVFLVEQRRHNELCLEHINDELRMEQVRQLSEKFSWHNFGPAVRRNLLWGKSTLDTGTRVDCLKGLAFMRANMPIDASLTTREKFRIMAESLECSASTTETGWHLGSETMSVEFRINEELQDRVDEVSIGMHGEPPFRTEHAVEMLARGEWTEFRDRVAHLHSFYDKRISSEDLILCKQAWRMMLQVLEKYASDPCFASVSRLHHGYYLPPEQLRPGRVYYLVEPVYRNLCARYKRYRLEASDRELLPFFELSFVEHDAGTGRLPTSEGIWDEKTSVDVAIRLKLSSAVLLSRETKQKLGEISAKTASVRHYTNCYRFLLGRAEQHVLAEDGVRLVTQFPDGLQHLYLVDRDSLIGVADCAITEIYLRQLDDVAKVVAMLRNERMHQSLWESMLAMCYEQQGLAEQLVTVVPMRVTLDRSRISIRFDSIYGRIHVSIRDPPGSVLDFRVEVFRGDPEIRVADRIDGILSRKLNETWSIPLVIAMLVSGSDCFLARVKVPLRDENPETAARLTTTRQ